MLPMLTISILESRPWSIRIVEVGFRNGNHVRSLCPVTGSNGFVYLPRTPLSTSRQRFVNSIHLSQSDDVT